MAGALVAGSGEGDVLRLPHEWMQRMQGWDAAAQLAQKLVALRD